jgi:HEPN domain-containing protein
MLPDPVRSEVRGWIRKAENDFKTLELLLPNEDAPLDSICFHAQQGTEKYIKGLLTALGIPFRKTHDLSELVCLFPSTSRIADEVGDLSDLTDAAVSSRYPGEIDEYDRPTVEELVKKAYSVKLAILIELKKIGFES